MTEPRFLQIHYLTAYPASLLNRDDAGAAKQIPFGGATRTRISSQCLKRHWRMAEGEYALQSLEGVEMSVRSRRIFEDLIASPLIEGGLNKDAVREAVKAVQAQLLGKSEKAKKAEAAEDDDEGEEKSGVGGTEKALHAPELETSQVIVLGKPEINYLKKVVGEVAKVASGKDAAKRVKEELEKRDLGKNLKALGRAATGLDGAAFGRMVTSDILARVDAAVHVAHAFTVHEEESESDYFTAVDDLVAATGELGSAHMGESELTSGLFYGYVVIDVPQLVSNMEGRDRAEWREADRTLASRVTENLVHLIATVTPGAKRGSTAPYACAQLVMIEAGVRQPRTLANAFLEPVMPKGKGGLLNATVEAIADHFGRYDKMYGKGEERRGAGMVDMSKLPVQDVGSLATLAKWAAERVREG